MMSVRDRLASVLLFCVLTLTGCDHRQLVTVTSQTEIPQRFWIRVLLLDDVKTCRLKVNSAFSVLDGQTQSRRFYFTHRYQPVTVSIRPNGVSIDAQSFSAKQIIVSPDAPYPFSLNGDAYHGKLKIVVNPDGKSFDAINLVPLESYLQGVIGAEMPDYWEPEALKAQAIAARTYCLYIKRQFGKNRQWDVSKTTANQVYLGLSAESQSIRQAVNSTKAKVLVCKYPDGRKDIFPTYYSSACGGHTENSKNVFGDDFGPLRGVPCPYCEQVARQKFFFWPMAELSRQTVSRLLISRYPKLKVLGRITKITPVKKSDYGKFSRLTMMKLTGDDGKSEAIRAEDLRLTLDPTGRKLRSTICQIVKTTDAWLFLSGRGWGHGVGMCQCGAEGMAREGKKASQILRYYYPGSEIVSVY